MQRGVFYGSAIDGLMGPCTHSRARNQAAEYLLFIPAIQDEVLDSLAIIHGIDDGVCGW